MPRRADDDDIPALLDLRAAMFTSMGQDPGREWREPAARWFTEHLGVDACAYVIDADDRPVAVALGYVHTAPPSPSSPVPTTGHLANVVTLVPYRRRGHARTCVEALLDWFRDETAVARVDLAASEDGLALYESLGWVRRPQPTLRLPMTR